MKAADVRKAFLDFFKSKGHVIVPSAPIVIKNDPTLLFTNAGMNQFKDFFLGTRVPDNRRVADTQKCLRVSGKHNDLEEVGVDTYHHTMFEMLGNWSFGDYFKKEAIEWSWELLTSVYGIPKENLYVTVFEGDESEGLPRDEEALEYWKRLVPEDHILFGNKKDNFWEMGDTGPCGPCTEIHADTRSAEEKQETQGAGLVNRDHPQVIEIWNNVFIQFNRKKDGSLEPLPEKHVDTGMGFERLVRVLQNRQSNYDTDVFTPTIAAVAEIAGKVYRADDTKESVAFRVIADHIRAIAFAISDGQLPSNTGAGYVIRRILRRAVRYYYSYLDRKEPLLYLLVPQLATEFENVFPELKKQEDFVSKVVREEEDSFLRTLEKGLKKIDELISSSDRVIGGEAAFELFDTFGFPIDLTRLIAGEKNIAVDEAGFENALQAQKTRSRAATAMDVEDWIVLREGNGTFSGYEETTAQTEVLRYRKVKGKGKEQFQIVLAETPFYAESGGQIGDRGELRLGGKSLTVSDTKKENGVFIHFADEIAEDMSLPVVATIDEERRRKITNHHSVTHLLHAALRRVLGAHVAQKGSLVHDEYLRFDFSHFAKMTDEEVRGVESLVNKKIRENIPVVIRNLPREEALKTGAMALFGEKYGDVVRVVTIDPDYSIELCGGTHVGNTGELGFFKITAESAVAAGVRRIEAVSGEAAEALINAAFDSLETVKGLLKNPGEPGKAVEALQSENAALSKRIEALEARQLVAIRNELLQKDEIINGITFVGQVVEVPGADALKKLCFDLKHHLHDHVLVLCANVGGKAQVAVGVSDTVVAARSIDANALIKEIISPLIKGGGGGQKTLATAGGTDCSAFQTVIGNVKDKLLSVPA